MAYNLHVRSSGAARPVRQAADFFQALCFTCVSGSSPLLGDCVDDTHDCSEARVRSYERRHAVLLAQLDTDGFLLRARERVAPLTCRFAKVEAQSTRAYHGT